MSDGLRLAVGVVLGLAALSVLAGCGGGGSGGPVVQADVPVAATVEAGTPGEISSVTVATQNPGDTLDVTGATASIERPDATSSLVTMNANPSNTAVTLGRATVIPSPAEAAADASGEGDVPLVATVTTGPWSIVSATVATVEPGDTLDIAGARAYLNQGDGPDAPVDLAINEDGTVVTLGQAEVRGYGGSGRYWWLNALTIEGPVEVRDGSTGRSTTIGTVAFSFAVGYDGEVIAPSVVRATVPTIGTAADRRIVAEGLAPETGFIWAVVTDTNGGTTYSRVRTADSAGQAVIPDTKGLITAETLSGPNSRIELCFADFTRNAPPAPGDGGPWPPVYGPGPGDGTSAGDALNWLIIDGPIRVRDGGTGTVTTIGRLAFAFEVLADGTVIAPRTIEVSLPTSGSAQDKTVVVTGLRNGAFVQTVIRDAQGGLVRSRIHQADRSERVVLRDAQGHITAGLLSGPNSSITMLFALTDANDDGVPDLF